VSATYDELIHDPDVDAVYVPLVNSLHREWSLRALAAGKHVLCEKPLAMNAEEAMTMSAAADAAGLYLMEAFMYRFHPRVRSFIEGLHRPVHVQASFGFPLNDKANYRLQPELGGGALLDVGCYVVSVARWILGEPDHLLAQARLDGVDMSVSALLRFPNQATASVWASFESAEEQELTVVSGDRTWRLDKPFTTGGTHDPYQLMVESFADSVLHNQPVAIPLSESIANMTVLDRIREAAGLRPVG
jgi:xylose dehydrogenase (NAD/NADP)